MASPLFIAQKFLSLLQNNVSQPNDPAPNQCTNCTPGSRPGHDNQQLPSSSSQSPETAAHLVSAALKSLSSSNSAPSLINLFFSSSAARDWLKLVAYGSVLEMFRRLVLYIYGQGFSSFFVTATFTDNDPTYLWLRFWLSRQPAWRNARDIEVTDSLIESRIMDDKNQEVAFLPSMDVVCTIWYKGRWMQVSQFTKKTSYDRLRCCIQLCIFDHSHKTLKSVILDSKKAYEDAQLNSINVFISKRRMWTRLTTCSKRSIRSIILDPGLKDNLIDDVKDFMSCKAWYTARGIPFRRGYLLYGPPGTGKTSIIHGLAGELGLDVYTITLSKVGMDDSALTELITRLPEKCIALMEDVDAAFSRTINRESKNSQKDDKDKAIGNGPSTIIVDSSTGVTLSGLLNALDGVGAQEGRILFATTNKFHALDPALCRPGRMDIHVEFKLASRYQMKELFRRFYMPNSELDEEDKEDKDDIRPQGTPTSNTKTNGSDSGTPFLEGHAGRQSLRVISRAELDRLADEFADAIPVEEFSMATLQGYLMKYKVEPETAVKEAGNWVTKEREESQRRKTEKPNKSDGGSVQIEASDTVRLDGSDTVQVGASDT